MKRFLAFFCTLLMLVGCGNTVETTSSAGQIEQDTADSSGSISKTGSLELQYATQFAVDFYDNDYIHISVADGTDYVCVPEDKEENSLGLNNPVYIHMPCNNIYLAASSAMDLFLELDALGEITACSTQADDYAMTAVREAIESEQIKYVGKYSAPDYEILLERGCNLAIESTMISHSPKIKEQLERINIPVFVERSSYEESPIGRLEWIKLYGVLTGREEEAVAIFDRELAKIDAALSAATAENTTDSTESDLTTVAFFSITSTGYVTVRKPGDYICKMIEMGGGEYALNNLLIEEENALSTVNIGMEDFYREAHDADILIYNGSIDGGVNSIDELLDKNELLGDFDAVKAGRIWSTSLNMFQESSKIADIIVEMSNLINDRGGEEIYLKHLN